MAVKMGVYKCELCGNIVEVFISGGGELVCCGQKMKLLEEKTADSSLEKHVPFIEETSEGYKVRVGEKVDHPMTPEHYIQWIELIAGDKVYREYLNPGQKPEVLFKIEKTENITAKEYCNLHGLWKK